VSSGTSGQFAVSMVRTIDW